MSGIVRIALGVVVLVAGAGIYFGFASKFGQEDTQVMLGSSGIEVSWPMFLIILAVTAVLGLALIGLGVRSLSSDD